MRAILFVLAFSVFNPAFASGDYLLCGPIAMNDFGCSNGQETFMDGKCLMPLFDVWLSAPPEAGSLLNFLVGPSSTELPVGELTTSKVTYEEEKFVITYVIDPSELFKQWQSAETKVDYIGGQNRKLYYEGKMSFVKFGAENPERETEFGCIRN